MFNKFVLAFAIVALALATAGTVPAPGGSYKVTLIQPSVLNGTDVKAGEYRINIGTDKVTFLIGKNPIEVPVKIETVEQKFDTTAIRYVMEGGKSKVAEIRLGGTKTKLLFQ